MGGHWQEYCMYSGPKTWEYILFAGCVFTGSGPLLIVRVVNLFLFLRKRHTSAVNVKLLAVVVIFIQVHPPPTAPKSNLQKKTWTFRLYGGVLAQKIRSLACQKQQFSLKADSESSFGRWLLILAIWLAKRHLV